MHADVDRIGNPTRRYMKRKNKCFFLGTVLGLYKFPHRVVSITTVNVIFPVSKTSPKTGCTRPTIVYSEIISLRSFRAGAPHSDGGAPYVHRYAFWSTTINSGRHARHPKHANVLLQWRSMGKTIETNVIRVLLSRANSRRTTKSQADKTVERVLLLCNRRRVPGMSRRHR